MTRRFREHNIALADRMYPPQRPRQDGGRGPRRPRPAGRANGQGAREHTEREARAQVYRGMAEWRMLEKAAKSTNAVIQIK